MSVNPDYNDGETEPLLPPTDSSKKDVLVLDPRNKRIRLLKTGALAMLFMTRVGFMITHACIMCFVSVRWLARISCSLHIMAKR